MKKFCLTLTTILLAASASLSFAAADKGGYYSSDKPAAKGVAAKALFPATNISIINGTNGVVFALIPEYGYVKDIYPGEDKPIQNNNYYGDSHIVLQGPAHDTFFDQYVCRAAVISVFGERPNYHYNVNTEYCN